MLASQIKVSVDFDSTLSTLAVQKYITELVFRGFEVHIVTARFDSVDKYTGDFMSKYQIDNIEKAHQHLFDVADLCGISRDRIHFMNMADKYEFFTPERAFLWHLDDDQYEIDGINRYTETIGISCSGGSNWKGKCERFIKKKLKE